MHQSEGSRLAKAFEWIFYAGGTTALLDGTIEVVTRNPHANVAYPFVIGAALTLIGLIARQVAEPKVALWEYSLDGLSMMTVGSTQTAKLRITPRGVDNGQELSVMARISGFEFQIDPPSEILRLGSASVTRDFRLKPTQAGTLELRARFTEIPSGKSLSEVVGSVKVVTVMLFGHFYLPRPVSRTCAIGWKITSAVAVLYGAYQAVAAIV